MHKLFAPSTASNDSFHICYTKIVHTNNFINFFREHAFVLIELMLCSIECSIVAMLPVRTKPAVYILGQLILFVTSQLLHLQKPIVATAATVTYQFHITSLLIGVQ